ncbi:hypothetical protein Tco_0784910 [Tanacetum coccineum]
MLTRASECPNKFDTCLFQCIPYRRFCFSNVLHKRLEDESAIPISVRCYMLVINTVGKDYVERYEIKVDLENKNTYEEAIKGPGLEEPTQESSENAENHTEAASMRVLLHQVLKDWIKNYIVSETSSANWNFMVEVISQKMKNLKLLRSLYHQAWTNIALIMRNKYHNWDDEFLEQLILMSLKRWNLNGRWTHALPSWVKDLNEQWKVSIFSQWQRTQLALIQTKAEEGITNFALMAYTSQAHQFIANFRL